MRKVREDRSKTVAPFYFFPEAYSFAFRARSERKRMLRWLLGPQIVFFHSGKLPGDEIPPIFQRLEKVVGYSSEFLVEGRVARFSQP